MKVLFVYGNLYALGGIETWLTRMVPRLRAEGHEVALLTRPRGEHWDVTSAVIDQLSQDATVHLAGRDWFRAPRSIQAPLRTADIIFAGNLQSLLLAALVRQHRMPTARLVAGVFHPREYCSKGPRLQRRWGQHVAERVVREIPLENFMFSTDGMAYQTGECLGRDLSRSPVLPIPIDTERFRPSPNRRVDRSKIVSVTRLTSYYTHHEQMIRVIRELRDQGHGFAYHAYGDGNARMELESQARRLGVDDAVFFHGTVPYDQFAEAVSDAFAYIGFGTALIEAAACGVPALVGIDGHRGPDTYGFVHETVGNDIGGYVPGHTKYPIAERVLWLARRTEDEYRQLEDASRARAQEFSITRLLPRFVEILRQASPFSTPISVTDRVLGQLDWLLEAVLLNLGAPDGWSERYVRPLSTEESNSSPFQGSRDVA